MTMVFSTYRFFFFAILLVIAVAEKTYYQLLEVEQDASLKDIKKAYRRLALQHHPDRNRGNEKEAELIFRDISEAYEVLSDENSRGEYDRSLRYGGGSQRTFRSNFQRSSRHRDPFAQFNDLFQNDEFFKSASEGMENLFNKMFEKGNDAGGRASDSGGGRRRSGISFTSTTTTSSSFGGRTTSTTTRSSSSGGGGSYEARSVETKIENGKRVTYQSFERNGNKIKEKYIGEELIERMINGVADKEIGAGDEF